MKSIKIYKLDDALYKALQNKAEELGLSLSKTIKHLLREYLGIRASIVERNNKKLN